MRKSAHIAIGLLCVCQFASAQQVAPLATQPAAPKISDAAAYGVGYQIGMQLRGQGIGSMLKQADLFTGIMHAIAGKELALPQQQCEQAIQALSQKLMQQQQQLGKDNLAAANKFLEENKKREGITTTDSGLQYQVLKKGSGAAPTAESTVSVHYEGKLLNGEIFDSSIARGEPAQFGVTQVIPGWTEALLRMKVGDKLKLFIPPALAYREQGSPPAIGPNELLTFEVELLEVK